jgi:hypothetical protein
MEEKDRRRLYRIRRFMGYFLLAFSTLIFFSSVYFSIKISLKGLPLLTFILPVSLIVFCALSIPLVKQFLDPKHVGL